LGLSERDESEHELAHLHRKLIVVALFERVLRDEPLQHSRWDARHCGRRIRRRGLLLLRRPLPPLLLQERLGCRHQFGGCQV
jgi:hypothetical protein